MGKALLRSRNKKWSIYPPGEEANRSHAHSFSAMQGVCLGRDVTFHILFLVVLILQLATTQTMEEENLFCATNCTQLMGVSIIVHMHMVQRSCAGQHHISKSLMTWDRCLLAALLSAWDLKHALGLV